MSLATQAELFRSKLYCGIAQERAKDAFSALVQKVQAGTEVLCSDVDALANKMKDETMKKQLDFFKVFLTLDESKRAAYLIEDGPIRFDALEKWQPSSSLLKMRILTDATISKASFKDT